MYEVYLGDNKQGRHLMSAGSESEAVAFAKSNLFRYGGRTLTVIEERLDKDSGLYRTRIVWQSKKAPIAPDQEQMVEAARFRRKMLR